MKRKDFKDFFSSGFTSIDPGLDEILREMNEFMRGFERGFFQSNGRPGIGEEVVKIERSVLSVEPEGNRSAGSLPSGNCPSGYRKAVIDTIDDGLSFRVIAEMPGVTGLEDIVVQVDKNCIIIRGEGETRRYYSEVPVERQVDERGMKSSYNNGILELTFRTGEQDHEST